MKVFTKIILLAISTAFVFGTMNRVATLGGDVSILPDDDNNIYLFPQKVNQWSLVLFENIQSGSPEYLLITGETGKKWAFYGGNNQKDDFLNVYKSLGEKSALKLGFRMGTYSESSSWNDKEAGTSNITADSTNKYTNFGIDTEYGLDAGQSEIAVRFGFSFGPGSIKYLTNMGFVGPFGTVELINKNGTATSEEDGKASSSSFGLSASLRRPMKFLMFENLYASFGLSRTGSASEYNVGSNKAEELINSALSFSVNTMLFNNKTLIDNSLLVYGLGFGFGFSNSSKDNDIAKKVDTDSNFMIGGPRFRVGIETPFKYGKLRFGVRRNIDFFSTATSVVETPDPGATTDEFETKISGIGTNGSYAFASGVGFTFGNLNLDLVINNTFWCTGPQMIFYGNGGTLAASADVSYYFK